MSRKSGLGSIDLIFLGTASAQPSSTRNHSSLAVRLAGDVWLFDCGEATQHQLQKSILRMGKIKKIFITHMHGDHIFGLVPLMTSLANGAGNTVDDADDHRLQAQLDTDPLEIYGPLGTRAYVRACLTFTHSILTRKYVVHELRFHDDPSDDGSFSLPIHTSEMPGRNIPQVDGVWRDIFRDDTVAICAGPILHSIPCVGYVITEAPKPGKMDPKQYIPDIKRTRAPISCMSRLQQGESVELPDGTVLHGPPRRPGRKIVILGDTYDPSPMSDIAASPDVLVHEATNAHLPGVDSSTKPDDTFESVETRAKSRGHSTPQLAGAFATRIGARKLILNHFSARYPGDDERNVEASRIMEAIASLAKKRYDGEIVCARDLMTVEIKPSTTD
ncbi:Metallo-hydrolase oxidoreductase [Pisolithus croceorrhizus]|nr:Metallo-hydrolase oxidoreductase [Pisolithus croceorrhizus]